MENLDIDILSKEMFKLWPLIEKKFVRPYSKQYKPQKALTALQFNALDVVYEKGKCIMTDLAKELNITKQQLTPMVDKLVEAGYLIREHDKSNRRVIIMTFSDLGLREFKERRKKLINWYKDKLLKLGENDLIVLKRSLNDMTEILNKIL